MNLPLHLWDLENVKGIGKVCGGFLEVYSKSSSFGCVRMKVRNTPKTILAKVAIEWGG